MRFDSKVDAKNHLTSMQGNFGRVLEYFDSLVLQLPTRASMYEAERQARSNPSSTANVNIVMEDSIKIQKNDKSGVWEMFAKRGNEWVLMK